MECLISRARCIPLRLEGCPVRPLGLRRDASEVPPLSALPVHQRRMTRLAVIPNNDRSFLPLDTRLEVGAVGDVVVQKFEQCIALFLLQPDDIASDWREDLK
jgi:hypothetical protein